ncbi:MAG: 16S rRNA (guanine(527)-N(7))-methyltransferase RsmG [Candidatus Promineifilaceae bacterium]
MPLPSNDLSTLAEGANAYSISLSDKQLGQFARYKELLLDWNKRINLTAITGDQDIQIRHFLDSLSCTLVTGDLSDLSLVDAGTGAGFPGLPLKIFFPELKLTLVESVSKKTAFLEVVVDELGLEHVEIIAERLEVVGQDPDYRESFDWAVSRGVAKLAVLVEYLLPLCRIGGRALSQKGEGALGASDSAARVIKLLGGGEPEIRPVDLPGRQRTHYLIVIPKVYHSPSKYPRRPGIPSKRPLA